MTIPALRHLDRPFDDAHIPVVVTQPFGHDAPGLEPSCWNYGGGVYGFAWEPGATQGSWHLGCDYGLALGTPLLAPAAGIVHSAGWDDTGFGLCTILDHGSGLYTLHAHQSKLLVSPGQQVAARAHIGDVGSTGNSTGPHLHFATITPDGRGYWYFFDPQLSILYQPAVLPPSPAPAPTAGRYKVLTAMHLRAMPAKTAAQGVLVNVGDVLTADDGWTTSWRRCKTQDNVVGWAFAPNLAAA